MPDLASIPPERVREILERANRIAEVNAEPTSVSTEWIRSRNPEEQAVLKAVRDLSANGPGAASSEQSKVVEIEASGSLKSLLSVYAREVDKWE